MLFFSGIRRKFDYRRSLFEYLATTVESEVVVSGDFAECNGQWDTVFLWYPSIPSPPIISLFMTRFISKRNNIIEIRSKFP